MFGLSFLNSIFLWGMAAASIPLIIHLIKRNKAVKLPFAAIRFLQLEPNQRVKSQKLKQLLLLLMRMAAMALLAMAFARPYFQELEAGGIFGEESKAAVILIDHSFSMGYQKRLGSAISEAQKLIRAFKHGDQVTVMQFSEKAETIAQAEDRFGFIADQIGNRLSLTMRSTNFMTAVQSAETALLEAPQSFKAIYLISDFQESGLQNSLPYWKLQPGIHLFFVPVGDEAFANVAIKEVHISSNDKAGSKRDVLVRVLNLGPEPREASLSLKINDKISAKRSLKLAADEEKIIELKEVRFPKGTVAGEIEIDVTGEEIVDDNRYFFVLETTSKAQILAVNGEPDKRDVTKDELFYVDRAINLPRLAKYTMVETEARGIGNHEFSDYRAVMLLNIKDLSRDVLERLNYYVRGGGGLLIALGDRVNPTIFNQLFRELSPADLTNPAFASPDREHGVILAEVDYQHPIFKLFSQPGHGDPGIAQFYQYIHARPHKAESVLAAFDDGSPALLERKVGDGKIILFTSSFDAEWNNLPIKAIFLPMLYQILQYLVSEDKGQKAYLVNQPIALRKFSQEQLEKGDIQVQLPSGDEIDLKTSLFDQTATPGIYKIKRKGRSRALTTFAVNVDTKESDLTPLEMEELERTFLVETADQVQAAAFASPKIATGQEQRQKIWRLVILAIVLLLVGETWLANRTYR